VAQAVAIVLVALPALALVLWPLMRRRGTAGDASAVTPGEERRLELSEEKAAIYGALKELAFDHEAGHLSDEDYQDLRGRYEGRAAEILRALDALGPAPAARHRSARPAETATGPTPARGFTRSPATLAVGAILVLLFGVVLGLNVGRFTEPDLTTTPPGSRLPVPMADARATGGPGPLMPPAAGAATGAGSGKALAPEMRAGMLRAARQSLSEGRYQEAIAAYQAILKRDADNVDAMTHLALIVAIGGHADTALETWKRALSIDPDYAPAYLYRGEVLFEVKKDFPGAIEAWQRFVTLVPEGEDRARIQDLIRQAQAKQGAR